MNAKSSTPLHSVAHCPICGGGLLGIRLCHGDPSGELAAAAGVQTDGPTTTPHGVVICDECDALWTEPSMHSSHQYPDAEAAKCPRCQTDLWTNSHWAGDDEIARLGWIDAIDRNLDLDRGGSEQAKL